MSPAFFAYKLLLSFTWCMASWPLGISGSYLNFAG